MATRAELHSGRLSPFGLVVRVDTTPHRRPARGCLVGTGRLRAMNRGAERAPCPHKSRCDDNLRPPVMCSSHVGLQWKQQRRSLYNFHLHAMKTRRRFVFGFLWAALLVLALQTG